LTGKDKGMLAQILSRSDILLSLGVVGIIVMMIIPVAPIFLDMLLALNIMLALVIMLVALFTIEPLQFSIFPGMLLILTLFRLSMNVASTRLILGEGYAGKVIAAFGDFVAGGNLVVGFIVFLILVIINFIVITKGAGRVAEVAARFTLDAMPGKQMAIDADLNNGLIDENEARFRREKIGREADFYGAMDGASKFVRGDAVAGLIITTINLLGGMIIGSMQLGMTFAESASAFSLLTVGDGLVNQIPSLIVSASAGIIVTRAGTRSDFSQDMVKQLFWQHRPLLVSSMVLALFAIVPGLPTLPFFLLSVLTGGLGLKIRRTQKEEAEEPKEKKEEKVPERIEDYLALDTMEIELGYGLIPLVDRAQGGDLLQRITLIRKQIASELGIIIPPIRIRDDVSLLPEEYSIRVRGNQIAHDILKPGWVLVLGAGGHNENLHGIQASDPTFGMDSLWVRESQSGEAARLGYAVVDPSAVMATHLEVLIRKIGWKILGRQDVKKLLDNLKPDHAALVDELYPSVLSLGVIHKVLQKLLRESIPIRDLCSVLEILSDFGEQTKDPEILAEYARFSLSATISNLAKGDDGRIKAATFNPDLESVLLREKDGTRAGTLRPEDFALVIQALKDCSDQLTSEGRTPILVTRPEIRSYVRRLLEGALPDLMVLAYSELSMEVELESIAQIALPDQQNNRESVNRNVEHVGQPA
jgi:flagellar biosynthesis protein FlhA